MSRIARFVAVLLMSGAAAPLALAEPDPAAAAASLPHAEQQTAPDRVRIRVTGAAGMEASSVREAALQRAAQVTLDHGGAWFEILPPGRAPRRASTVDSDFGPDYATSRTCGTQGCSVKASPLTAEGVPVYEHVLEIMIGQGEALEGGRGRIYAARDIVSGASGRVS